MLILRVLSFSLVLLVPFFAGANLDSLQNARVAAQDDKEKALVLAKLAGYYLELDTDSSMHYAEEGIELSKSQAFDLGVALNASHLGDNYVRLDSIEKAKYYYSIAADTFTDEDVPDVHSKVLLVLGNIHFVTNNFPEALDAYQKSMQICESHGFTETLAHLHNNIGSIYFEMEHWDKAVLNKQAAYDGFISLDAELNAAMTLISLAVVLKELADYDQALKNLNDALVILESLNNLEYQAEANRVIGLIYQDQDEDDIALSYFKKSLEFVSREDFQSLAPKSLILCTLYLNLAEANLSTEAYRDAENYAQKSLELAISNRYVKQISENYLILSKIHKSTSKIDDAYAYLELHKAYSDSVMSENAIEKITQLRLEHEFAKKISQRELAQSIKDAERQRVEYIYIISIVLILSIAIVGFLLFLNQKSKTHQSKLQKENLELERENLKQKLDLNEKELEHKNKELTTNIMYLTKKTGMIAEIAKELQKSKMEFEGENRDTVENVIRRLEENSSNDTWKEFELRFQDVHNEFYDNLNKAFPNLTPNEKKLCAFLKLNMSTKDISAITHQSVKSITMARYRLRQKLEIERDENLISFLSNL